LCGNGLSSRLVLHEKCGAKTDAPALKKRQEGTMQLRHIRPGSLEWQDAKAEEVDQGGERLTPEETIHLREMSDNRRGSRRNEKRQQTQVH
jgi:hypothetical protein